MTKQELNREVKKLFREYYKLRAKNENTPEHWTETERMTKRLNDLYRADTSLNSLSRENVLRMLSLNVSLRAVPFHQFGLMIEESKLM